MWGLITADGTPVMLKPASLVEVEDYILSSAYLEYKDIKQSCSLDQFKI